MSLLTFCFLSSMISLSEEVLGSSSAFLAGDDTALRNTSDKESASVHLAQLSIALRSSKPASI